ncbi:hypothetical protein [Nitrosomonas eutropha]|uniref:hypothetical protein n=1 Tax=Nitrosomonas eutropha TaxID=916 RepID=UPI0002DFAEA9|nr:hypothetical protein [Nitrosomonas eutropha]
MNEQAYAMLKYRKRLDLVPGATRICLKNRARWNRLPGLLLIGFRNISVSKYK